MYMFFNVVLSFITKICSTFFLQTCFKLNN